MSGGDRNWVKVEGLMGFCRMASNAGRLHICCSGMSGDVSLTLSGRIRAKSRQITFPVLETEGYGKPVLSLLRKRSKPH